MVFSLWTAAPLAAFTLGRSRNPNLDTAGGDFSAPNDAITARRTQRDVPSDAERSGNLDLRCMTTQLHIGQKYARRDREPAI
jgi:hypothetical protein